MNLDRITCALLNLPSTNDHSRLLGIPKGRADVIAVESALRRRLVQIQVHPACRSKEAVEVRAYLQRIASDLMQSLPNEPSSKGNERPDMTALDQAIIAVLIGDGGWNRQSRSRLVAVAATFNITVGGLARILEALAESSRTGEGPLSARSRSTITMDRSWTALPKKQTAMNRMEEFLDQATKRFTPELRSPSPVMTIKLSVLFALLTIIAFVLCLRVLLSSNTQNPIEESFANVDRNSIFNTPAEETLKPITVAFFDQYPTFNSQDLSSASINAADQILSNVRELSSLSVSIRDSLLRGDSPSREWENIWKNCVSSTSLGWMHVDSATLRSASDRMIDVLLQAELQQTYVDVLIQHLKITTLQLRSPMSVNQRVWSMGILARLGCDPKLSSLTRSSARNLQLPLIATCDEIEARYLALDLTAEELIELSEFDDRIFSLWESWISTVQQLGTRAATVDRFLYAMKKLLETNVDLSRKSNTRKVLGRILQEVEWTKGVKGRDFVIDLYRDLSVSSIDMMVLGHLFLESTNVPWFSDAHLVYSDDSRKEREIAATSLKRDWYVVATTSTPTLNLKIPAGLNPSLIKEWKLRLDKIQREISGSPSKLAILRLLNGSSVALWRGRPDIASDLINRLDNLDLMVAHDQQTIILPSDGNWSKQYFDARSSRTARIDAIDTLYNSDAMDLGPQDADTLASAALTQESTKIRVAATEAIVQQFSTGSNVAIAILNNLHQSRSKQQVAKLVANLTEAILPEFSDSRWDQEARRALVQHALTIRYPSQRELDAVSNELSRSLISETILIDPSTLPPSREVNALDAIKMLVQAWRRDLTTMYVPKVAIEFNPTGVMQEYLQFQLQYLQLINEEEARWRGLERIANPSGFIADVAVDSPDIVKQLIQVELAISLHWDRLLTDLQSEYERVME